MRLVKEESGKHEHNMQRVRKKIRGDMKYNDSISRKTLVITININRSNFSLQGQRLSY